MNSTPNWLELLIKQWSDSIGASDERMLKNFAKEVERTARHRAYDTVQAMSAAINGDLCVTWRDLEKLDPHHG